MARQNQTYEQQFSQVFKNEAHRIATNYKVTQKEVGLALRNLFELARDSASSDTAALQKAALDCCCTLDVLGSCLGIAYLSTAIRISLKDRLKLIHSINLDHTPYCTIKVLQKNLEYILEQQKVNRAHIVNYGLWPKNLSGLPWLAYHFGRLYDTRATRHSDEVIINAKNDFEVAYKESSAIESPYEWIRTVPAKLGEGTSYDNCKYLDADVNHGLNCSDVQRIEQVRPLVFDVRQNVIQEICKACASTSGEGLFNRCLVILEETLNKELLFFLSRMDTIYLGDDFRVRSTLNNPTKFYPGGLTNLLEVVGHVEDELQLRRIDALMSIPNDIDVASFDQAVDNYLDQTKIVEQNWAKRMEKYSQWLDGRQEIASGGKEVKETPNAKIQFVGRAWEIQFNNYIDHYTHTDGLYYIAFILNNKGREILNSELEINLAVWAFYNLSGRSLSRKLPYGSDSAVRHLFKAQDSSNPNQLGHQILEQLAKLKSLNVEIEKDQVQLFSKPEDIKSTMLDNNLTTRLKIVSYLEQIIQDKSFPEYLKKETRKSNDNISKKIITALNNLRLEHLSLKMHLQSQLMFGAKKLYLDDSQVKWRIEMDLR